MTVPLFTYKEITGMHLELTNKCNSKCPMCPRYINEGSELNPLLQLDEVTIDQFKEWFPPKFIAQLVRIMSCGCFGDPIVAQDTLDIYEYMRANNERLVLSMHTNASARSTDWWREMGKLCNQGVGKRGDYVTFSIDGLEDTNHLYRRGTSWSKIMENVEAFISAGGIAHWDFIVFRHNEHQVDEAFRLAKKLGFENFNIKRTSRWSDWTSGPNPRGIYRVKNKKNEVVYTYEQPLNNKYQEDSYKVFKDNLELGPTNFTLMDKVNFEKKLFKTELQKFDPETGKPFKIKHAKIPLKCRVMHYKKQHGGCGHGHEIYLQANGYLYPCCFLGGIEDNFYVTKGEEQDSMRALIELNGGLDSISLKKHTLEEIIETPIYQQYLPETFEINHPMRSFQCSSCCGENNMLDSGELGSKQSGYEAIKKGTIDG